MKALFFTALLWAGFFVSFIQGQESMFQDFKQQFKQDQNREAYNQNLNVYHQNELVAVVSGYSIYEIKKENEWRNLLTSFQENLASIKDQIPAYLIYKIEYQKDYNLIVEEEEGKVRYNVIEGKSEFDTKQSKAILNASNFKIQLNFEKIEDLEGKDYEAMIESAMTKVGIKRSMFGRAYSPKHNYNYSYSKKEMIDIKDKKEKTKLRLVIPFNGTIGLYKGGAIYEVNAGLGVSFRKEKSSRYDLLYVFIANLWQYDNELDAMRTSDLFGVAWKTKRAGTFHIAFPMSSNPNTEFKNLITDETGVRIGGTFHARSSLAVTTNLYYRSFDDIIPSLSFGFSF